MRDFYNLFKFSPSSLHTVWAVFQLSWLPDKLVHVPEHSREHSGVLDIFTTKSSSKGLSKKLFSNLTNVKVPQKSHGQFNYCKFKITKKNYTSGYGAQMQCRDEFHFRIRRYIRLANTSQQISPQAHYETLNVELCVS